MKTAFAVGAGCIFLMAGPSVWAQHPRTVSTHKVVAGAGGSYLGVGVADVDAERAKMLNLREERGVEVKSVDEDSPAAKAGIKEGDVIVEFNGQAVEGTQQFVRLVRETPAGRSCKIVLSRNGAAQTVSAAIGRRKAADTWFVGPGEIEMFGDSVAPPAPAIPSIPALPAMPSLPRMPDLPRSLLMWNSPALGIESESLGSQLAVYFGVKEGVLVRSVMKGSAAAESGMKAGDVIVKVDGTHVTTPREISSLLHSVRSKKTIPVIVMRYQKEMTLNVTLNENSEWRSAPEREEL